MARQAVENNTMGFAVPDLMGIDVEKVGPFKQALNDYYKALYDAIAKLGLDENSEIKPYIEAGIRGEAAREAMRKKLYSLSFKCLAFCEDIAVLIGAIDNLVASYEQQDQNTQG